MLTYICPNHQVSEFTGPFIMCVDEKHLKWFPLLNGSFSIIRKPPLKLIHFTFSSKPFNNFKKVMSEIRYLEFTDKNWGRTKVALIMGLLYYPKETLKMRTTKSSRISTGNVQLTG